jgi:hypothetical protein
MLASELRFFFSRKKAEFTVLTSILIDFTPAAAKFATGLQAEAGMAIVYSIFWSPC